MTSAPSTSTTAATTFSPHSVSGTPTTQASATAGWACEDVLDLARRQVLGAPHDHVVEAAVQVEEAVLVEDAARRGSGTSRPRWTSRRPRYSPATCSPRTHSSPCSPGLTGLPSASRISTLERRQRLADRAEPAAHVRVVAGEGLAMVVGAEHGDGGAGLGEPVGVDEVDVRQERQGPLDHGHRHAPAAVGEVRAAPAGARRRASRTSRMRPSMVGTTIAWVTASSRAVSTQTSGVKAAR